MKQKNLEKDLQESEIREKETSVDDVEMANRYAVHICILVYSTHSQGQVAMIMN